LHFDINPLSRLGLCPYIKLNTVWLRQMKNFVLLNGISQ
jgi:hypothetical protein